MQNLTVADGFKFGCGFLLALAAFTFVLFILASLVYLVLTLLNVQVPLGVRPGG
jgi:hypothetical protein